jgi:ubiquinone/menaquinone biosynthesis C-methylase UbiE
MNSIDFLATLKKEYEAKFSGWDFSHLDGHMVQDPLPWNYTDIINEYIKNSNVMLDMGTGGGEFLDSLPYLPRKVYATEGYEPNIEIARQRLAKKNIEVRVVNEDDKLNFDNCLFDLIINRHESYNVDELFRVLKPNSYFITQQVGGMNDYNLNSYLGASQPKYFNWCLVKTIEELYEAGFSILKRKETIGKSRFYDIASIVYYLKCIPWQIDNFSVDKYSKRLELLNDIIEEQGFIDFLYHRFILVAYKD